MFIRFYYAVSPKLVAIFKDTSWLNKMCKYPLDKMVDSIIQRGYDNTEYIDSK